MPQCLECGFVSPRLQWTHFKYKCTGKFNNGKEYMLAYPDAKVVDDDLAARCAVTLPILIQKYGEEIGQQRWESYKQKQAITNSFEYKQQRYGWTKEEFDEYNSSRAVTVENLVKRWGLEKGVAKWEEYCEKQKITKSQEYVVERYGQEYWDELCKIKSKPHNAILLAEKENITIDQAVEKIAARFGSAWVSNLEIEFVKHLERQIGAIEHSNLSKPYGKWNHETDSYVVYDIKHNDCIIEFNGDYWHANPEIYSEHDEIRNVSARDIWAKDEKKLEIARKSGYRVYVVWEKNYRSNKEKTIQEVVKWIQNIPE